MEKFVAWMKRAGRTFRDLLFRQRQAIFIVFDLHGRRVIVYVELTFAGVSIPRSRLQWSQAGSLGKHRTSLSVGRFSTLLVNYDHGGRVI